LFRNSNFFDISAEQTTKSTRQFILRYFTTTTTDGRLPTHTQACKPKMNAGGRGGGNLFLSGYRTWANLIRASLSSQTYPVSLRERATKHTSLGYGVKLETRILTCATHRNHRVWYATVVRFRELLLFTFVWRTRRCRLSYYIIGPRPSSQRQFIYLCVYRKPTSSSS